MRLLPFDYAIRNLGRSPHRLAATVLGSAVVVGVFVSAAAFLHGMDVGLARSGGPENVLLLGAGSEESIERSEIPPAHAGIVAAGVRGIRRRFDAAYVSPEVHLALAVSAGGAPPRLAPLRGITPGAFLVHPQVRIAEGRAPAAGRAEVLVGARVAARLGVRESDLAVGRTLRFERRDWTIVGRMKAPATVMDAEIWCPLNDLMLAARRTTLSCVVLTLDSADLADVDAFCKHRVDLQMVALRQQDYYDSLREFYAPIRLIVWATAGLVSIAGLFGGLNTLYAAFSTRIRELAALQTLGFSRRAIVLSLIQEATVASIAGALLAVLSARVLLDGLAVRFSMGVLSLRVDSGVVALGLAAGLLLGAAGALPPAYRCLRPGIPEALRAA